MNPAHNNTPGLDNWGYSNHNSYFDSASGSGATRRIFEDFESQCKSQEAHLKARLHLFNAFDSAKRVDLVQFREWLKPLHPVQLGQLDAEVTNRFNMHRRRLDFHEREVHLAGVKLPARTKTTAKCSGIAFALLGGLQFEQVAALLLLTPPALLPCSVAMTAVAATYVCGPCAMAFYSCMSTKGKLRGVQAKVHLIRDSINDELMTKIKKVGQKRLPPGQANTTPSEPASTSTAGAPDARATPAPAPMQPTFVTEPAEVEYPTQTPDQKADLTVRQLNSMQAKLQAQADEIAYLRAGLNHSSHQVGGAAL